MDNLEELVGSVGDGLGEVDPVRHIGDGSEGVDEGSVRAAAAGGGPPVVVESVASGVEASRTCAGSDHGGEIAASKERVLGTSYTRLIFSSSLTRERSPLRADINDPVADH